MALRKWIAAAAVFLLSSWFVIPAAVVTVAAVEDSRGEHHLFALDGASGPLLDKVSSDACPGGTIEVETLPIGPEHLINPRWVLRETSRPSSLCTTRSRLTGLAPWASAH